MKKILSIVTPCLNEVGNIEEIISRVRLVLQCFPDYDYEHIFIDNNSEDNTVEKLKQFASKDSKIRIIVNCRNFGPIRSPAHGLLQACGNAVIMMAADLQDPPELIREFIKNWEAGYKIVIGVKPKSKEMPLMFFLRRLYYKGLGRISDVPLIENFYGFGLYDREVVEVIRSLNDPYPYFRGLIAELGFARVDIAFEQPQRKRGFSKANFYTLYDFAMLGVTSHSKVPLRLATMCGFMLSFVSLLIAIGYGVAKLIFWDSFTLGMAPAVVGLFFFASVQLFFIGLLGEYIGTILTMVHRRPLVIEKERVNF